MVLSAPADEEVDSIVVRYSRTNEACLIFFGALFVLPGVWYLPSLAHTEPVDFGTGGSAAVAAWMTRALGLAPIMMLDLAFIIWAGSLGTAALWRLIERAPALVLDQAGIAFHASLYRRFVRWSEVEHVGIGEGRVPGLCIRLRRRFWSLTYPVTARTVEIKLVGANLSHGAARDIVQRSNQLRK